MTRLVLLLLCPLAFFTALSAHSQSFPNDGFAWQDTLPPIYAPPERPWVANMNPSPRFPITVRLELTYNGYEGDGFSGGGIGHVFNPYGENLQFKYRCGITFPSHQPVELYGRWVTPGRKLEISLRKPGTTRTRTCRISTTIHTLQASAP